MKLGPLAALFSCFIAACTFNIGDVEEEPASQAALIEGDPVQLANVFAGSFELTLVNKFVEVRTESTESGYPDPDAELFGRELAAAVADSTIMAINIEPDSIEGKTFDPKYGDNLLYLEIFGEGADDAETAERLQFANASIGVAGLAVTYTEEGVGAVDEVECAYRSVNSIAVLTQELKIAAVEWSMSFKFYGDEAVCRRVNEIYYSAVWDISRISDDPWHYFGDEQGGRREAPGEDGTAGEGSFPKAI